MFDTLVNIDLQTAMLFFLLRTREGLHIMYGLTLLASPPAIILGLGTTSVILCVRKHWQLAVGMLAGFVASEAFTFVAKILVHRSRPGGALPVIVENSFSFPSGHATSAAFFFGIMAYLLFRSLRGHFWTKYFSVFAAVVGVIVIDVSRLYLGVHYVSDVIAGNIVGLGGVLLAIWVISRLERNSPLPSCSPRVIAAAILAGLVVTLSTAAIWYYVGGLRWTS